MFAAMQASMMVMAIAMAVLCVSMAIDIWNRRR
jgi:hypothetical protein